MAYTSFNFNRASEFISRMLYRDLGYKVKIQKYFIAEHFQYYVVVGLITSHLKSSPYIRLEYNDYFESAIDFNSIELFAAAAKSKLIEKHPEYFV